MKTFQKSTSFNNSELTLLSLIVIGLSLSVYAAQHQLRVIVLGKSDSYCNLSDYFSCDKTALSPYGVFLGTPQSVWGIMFFAVALVAWVWRHRNQGDAKEQSAWFFRILFTLGTLYSLRLFVLTVFVIDALCPTCFVIHLLVYAGLFVSWRHFATSQSLYTSLRTRRFWRIPTLCTLCIAIATSLFLHSGPTLYQNVARLSNLRAALQERGFAQSSKPKTGFGASVLNHPDLDLTPDSPTIGFPAAPHTLVALVDYTCPHCASLSIFLTNLEMTFPKQLRVIFKNFPLDMSCNSTLGNSPHPHGCAAAYLSYCYNQAGEFKAFYDRIFSIYEYDTAQVFGVIPSKKMTLSALMACVRSEQAVVSIRRDIQLGARLKVSSTPVLFLDGYLVDATDQDELARRINTAPLK